MNIQDQNDNVSTHTHTSLLVGNAQYMRYICTHNIVLIYLYTRIYSVHMYIRIEYGTKVIGALADNVIIMLVRTAQIKIVQSFR